MSETARGLFAIGWCLLDIVAFCTAMYFFGGRR